MFDWFKSREERIKDYDNVVDFPKPVPSVPLPPKDEKEHYSIGVTNDNRITLRIGYTTLTMNQQGAHNLIEQLELFASQLEEDKEND
jgi:hypothetical protein